MKFQKVKLPEEEATLYTLTVSDQELMRLPLNFDKHLLEIDGAETLSEKLKRLTTIAAFLERNTYN